MKNPYILLAGDFMEDVYHIGTSTRMSPEEPTIPVVKITETFGIYGGAGNVLHNFSVLGCRVYPMCGIGDKPTKHRLLLNDRQIARWDEADNCHEAFIPPEVKDWDAVVISDYGKGTITPRVISWLASLNLPTFIDTKRSPRDFEEIRDATYFPNQSEWKQWLEDYALQDKVVHKAGADGVYLQSCGKYVRHLPSMVKKVVSVNGAGDTVLAAFVYAVLTGHEDPLLFSQAAAAVVCEKPRTATASREEIERMLEREEEQYLWGV